MTKIRLKQNFDFAAFVDKQSLPILKNQLPSHKNRYLVLVPSGFSSFPKFYLVRK
jgi:hypothetical protein